MNFMALLAAVACGACLLSLLSSRDAAARKLPRALAALRASPIRVEEHELLDLRASRRQLSGQLSGEAADPAPPPPRFANPVPGLIPEPIRLRDALMLGPSIAPQAHEFLLDLPPSSVSAAIGDSLRSAFGRDLEEAADAEDILSLANTEPLKIYVNWGNFAAETAKPHSTCFAAGDWSFTGAMNPGSPPPNNGAEHPICDGDYDIYSSSNVACWFQCTVSEVTNDERMEFLKANVDRAVSDLEKIYRVPKLAAPLTFTKGDMGSFNSNVLGWSSLGEVCGMATFGFCDTLLPDEFCSSGVPAPYNVVLNMVYKPIMWGGGSGATCETDQHGRPISIAFWNSLSLRDTLLALTQSGMSEGEKKNFFRGFSTHEINHGLGFNIGAFLASDIVYRKDVYSSPLNTGTKEDSLWHFTTNTRMSKLAQVHFDCWDEDLWDGVPLMGAVEGGRDSHQNSFIMIEDVESYGSFEMNTPFTLAALEDTGHYLANYTFSEFPNWGAYQGCHFVSTRCRYRDNDAFTYDVVASNDECSRDFKTTDSKYSKCAPTNCGSSSSCHPECVVLESENLEEYLRLRPVMNGTGAFLGAPKASDLLDEFNEFLQSDLFQMLLPVIIWLVTAIVLCCLRKMCCSTEKGAVYFSHFVSAVFLVFGLGVVGVAAYMYVFKDIFIGAISEPGIIGIGIFGFVITVQSFLQWKTATGTSPCMFKMSGAISALMLLIQFLLACWIIMYNYSLEEVSAAAEGGAKWEDHMLGFMMKPVESYLCESYRNCCEDPLIAADTDFTCTTSHEGSSSSLQDDLNDPSKEAFCEWVSGVKSSNVGAARGVGQAGCNLLEDVVEGFDRDMCQAEYCASGVTG
ncbi:hypothetical protein TeGR_g14076, partial [Tetraparma gracilis]